MDVREVGFKVLCDIEKNDNYLNIVINKYFKNLEISDMDRGFVIELIYGVIENKYYLDYIINKFLKIKVKKMLIYVKIFLRMGIY